MSEPTPRPAARLNPIYVFSAICMVFGLFALNGSLDYSPLPAHNLLLLIGVLNAYEALTLLIAYLLNRRGIGVDARTLIAIEALFLFDGAFLISELITVMPSVGVGIGWALVLAGVLKVWVILHIAGERLVSRTGLLALVMLLQLQLLPWIYKADSVRHAGELSAGVYYAGWWLIALAPVVAMVLWRAKDKPIVHFLVAIGMTSLLAHAATAGWVHRMDFTLANLGPVVVAGALLVGHGRLISLPRERLVSTEFLFPILAVLMSARTTHALSFEVASVTITPLRLMLLAAALVYVHGWLRHRERLFVIPLAAGAGLAIAGATTQAMGETFGSLVRKTIDLVRNAVPKTLVQWGWISVGAAFLLMIGGAVFSVRKAAARPVQQGPDQPVV